MLADELVSIFPRELHRKTRGRTSVTKAPASRENGPKAGVHEDGAPHRLALDDVRLYQKATARPDEPKFAAIRRSFV